MPFDHTIAGPDGQFGAYIAQPERPNGAALVVIQEIFGVNQVMRDLADHYANLGYVSIVPDLFWRIEPGIDINDKTPEEMSKAFELFGKFNIETGLIDIKSTMNYARTLSSKVGAVGYCLGGLLAFLTACHTDIDASVSYYGVSIDAHTDSADKISNPIMLHMAAEDQFVGKEAQSVIAAMAATQPAIHLHVYRNLDHAFARQGGDHFDAQGAALANQRTAEFFEQRLLK